MNPDSTNIPTDPRDQRLDVALNLLNPEGRATSGLLILTACVGLIVAAMMLAGVTVMTPAKPNKSKAETAATATSADFELSSRPDGASRVQGIEPGSESAR